MYCLLNPNICSSIIQLFQKKTVCSCLLFESGPSHSLGITLTSDQVREPQENSKAGQLLIYKVYYLFQMKIQLFLFNKFHFSC